MSFQEALGPHRSEIAADVANYTDIAPIVQISEVVEGERGFGASGVAVELSGIGVVLAHRPMVT